ncbi:ATP-dependent DNA ligase LigD phosphoesterase module /ATP-dependent DNA ligase LigD polymerase module [Mobilisporobacter senegalensis]|uniref:DNA ligase (ATP) n=1 Tax=Mobilisporobacter senegalensis TaxID=1329262 RepID=A0A3N1XI88_9FIRM|nr:DNA ligase D [Mobilisporobacter senegalensis]ROR25808.1 ATP-dependent DNA ligase LigD phosphoesterase module /ATP-dependent DNA ligase LigD polymerase module [Mobilisporobacter senegalensis]
MNERLNKYNQKRNFEKTLEPEGKTEISKEGLRFVVQHHMARREHYDLRLEWKGALLSWAVPKGPSYDTRDKRLAVRVEDHPLEYRNFEGTITEGEYGGGVIMLWDEGFWEPSGNVEEGLQKGELKLVLRGRRLKGKWALIRWKEKSGETRDNWLLLKEKDEYVKTDDGISELITSIRTGRTMKEIEGGEEEKIMRNPFDRADVQLAQLANKIPEGEEWLYELKYDGYRIVAFVEGNSVRLMTRNGNDYTNRFPTVASSLMDHAAGRPMVLDGEIAITDSSGKTDFQALQNYMKNPKVQNPTYIIFDLLALDGVDLRKETLTYRKEKLEILMKDAPKDLYYSRYVKGNGKESFAAACEAGTEGIVGKKADSIYSGTRNGDWIKLKCDKRQEFVIGGYTLTDKKVSGVSSLLLGVYEGEDLVYTGRAGTGISKDDGEMLEKKFENLKRTDTPFKLSPKPRAKEKITWLEPELVAEIKFAQWTKDNLLRQASFKGMRIDKDPKDIKKEKGSEETQTLPSDGEMEKPVEVNANSIMIQGIKITNPDKVMFHEPEITKEDVIRYYEKAAEHMLPYVSHRILSAVRCPKGISQACFFKKHPGPDSKGIITIPVTNGNGEMEDYFYIENISGLIYEVQMGTLEFHIWGSCVDELEKPDMMVFDLDPDEGMELSRVRQGVRDIQSILGELSLNSYLKTSGGKGYHVVVPLKPVVTWNVFHDFAKRVAEVMEQKWPDRYTSNVRKAKRTDKIFIDWIRNGRGATSIAPYSIRARKGAKVSMPISWDELDTIAPDGINMEDAILRISGNDPWQDFFKNNQMLR